MTKPDTQALYVMQNEFGLIKIGRSLDPERRRKAIQNGERCGVTLVAVFQGEGHREEGIHIGLDAYAIEGEWFEGTSTARAAIVDAIPALGACVWPHDHNPVGAQGWLDCVFARRDQRAIERMYHRIMTVHLPSERPGPTADCSVCLLLSLSETGDIPGVYTSMERGSVVAYVHRRDAPKATRIPPYTSELGTALGLWRDGTRPVEWTGTAYDCAAAMHDLYAWLRSGGAFF